MFDTNEFKKIHSEEEKKLISEENRFEFFSHSKKSAIVIRDIYNEYRDSHEIYAHY